MKLLNISLLTLMLSYLASAGQVDLLVYLPFENGYTDETGNGYDAFPDQNANQVSITQSGFRGMGADINDVAQNGGGNTGGSLDIPIDVNPATRPTVSFGGWTLLHTMNGFPGFMAIDNGGWDRGMHIQNQKWGIASGNNLPNVAPAAVQEWTYVVGTFDKGNNIAKLYVGNADPAVPTTTTGSRPDGQNSQGELHIEIGRYDNQDFDGVVDDVFVFDGALDEFQANAIRNMRLSGLDVGPDTAAAVFELFRLGNLGTAGGYDWHPVSGLATTHPGEVFTTGAVYSVVLDANGNGMSATPSGSVKGDPHFSTWTREKFDFHGVCDLVLLKSPRMDIQIRTEKTRFWSYVHSAAVRIGDDILEVMGSNNKNNFWLNKVSGDATKPITLDGYTVTFKQLSAKSRQFVIDLGTNGRIKLTTWNAMVSVTMDGGDIFNGSLGLMGSYPEGQKVARDGKTVIDDVNEFGQEWQVLSGEPMLFHNIDGPQHPEKCTIPSATQMRRRLGESIISKEDAMLACSRVSESDFDLCVFDVMATNDKNTAGAY